MLKVHILNRRRSDMTHEQFVAYWRDVHAPLLRKHPNWDSGFTEFMQQNYSYAILIYKGIVVDGFHRIIHALLDGKELIAAQSINELPAEAFVTPKRRQNEAESSAGVFSRCYV